MTGEAKIWEEEVVLPTYEVGSEDTNPIFLESRVYQGSSGAVYPYGVIDTITGEKNNKTYKAVYIENDYIRIMVLPELGGRIQRAYDKVMKRDFIYYNEVVKPALVGLLGPWISGGIEFNWPQHHRPTTAMSVDTKMVKHDDGSVTLWVGEVEPMRGLQVMTGFTLTQCRASIQIETKIFNGNNTPRHFLWWANPAVKGGEHHQSVFPPDVTAVWDHGRRDVSAFPIAKGTYYKVDYSAGVDISRYKNIPVPTSYMVDKSEYDFVGAYVHNEDGGLLHIADHHVSPGKKQWTWGNCGFGIAWDRNLTDDNGPYIEMMTGCFTDNQPDFSWLGPYEEKSFVQNFLPYSHLGTLENANIDAAVKMERKEGKLVLGVYAVSPLKDAKLKISEGDNIVFEKSLCLEPCQSWLETVDDSFTGKRLTAQVVDSKGSCVIKYVEHIPTETPLPEVPKPPLQPSEISSTDELYFIGQHLDQYLHATRSPYDYYKRALEIDPNDYRCNTALAVLEFNRASYETAEKYANNAITRAHRWNLNPQCGQASMIRGAARERMGKFHEAYDDYFKAIWSGNCRDAGFYALARLAFRNGCLCKSGEHVKKSLLYNGSNNLAMGLCALLKHKKGKTECALKYIEKQLEVYPISYVLYYVRYIITRSDEHLSDLKRVVNNRGENALHICNWLLSLGEDNEALEILKTLDIEETLPLMYQAALSEGCEVRKPLVEKAMAVIGKKVRFPNSADEIDVLNRLSCCWYAQYLIGCFFYAKRNYCGALKCWETVEKTKPDFAALQRLLGVYYYNKAKDSKKAEQYLRRAVELEPTNARMLFELDYLLKSIATSSENRVKELKPKESIVLTRDDLTAELLSLYHITSEWDKAAHILETHEFHPWEGGEGKVTSQFLINRQYRALKLMEQEKFEEAKKLLESALDYPLNLAEGRLVGQSDNDLYYLLVICDEKLKQPECAQKYLEKALGGSGELSEGRYYNDQPVDYQFYQILALNKSGDKQKATEKALALVKWAKDHKADKAHPDFFAVSLPDLIVLDSDLDASHQQHCWFVEALGHLALGDVKAFNNSIDAVFKLNPSHDKAHLIKYALACQMLA